MQIKARYHELRVFLALRPFNYLVGKALKIFPKAAYLPGVGYCVNDPVLARTILQDKEHFSFNDSGALGTLISELWGTTPTILSMEGEEHHRVKFSLLKMYANDNLSNLIGDQLDGFVAELKNQLDDTDGADLARLTRIYTNRITTKLLTGKVAPTDEELLEISDLVTETMGCVDVAYKTFTAANRAKAVRNVAKFKQIAKSYVANTDPKAECIINHLKELGYEEENCYGFISMFLVAGTVTVSAGLPRIAAMLIETNQMHKLKSPEVVIEAIDEGLRYVTPGPVFLHGVKKTTAIDGFEFKSGRRVLILLHNIMHRNKFNKDSGRFDIERKHNEITYGLWFGTGMHFCMGSVIAKAEMEAILSSLAAEKGQLKIVHRKYQHLGINPGYTSLVIARG